MCREDAELFALFRDREDHQRRVIPGNEIGHAVSELPWRVLPKLFRALLQKACPELSDSLEGGRRFFDEIQQFSVHVFLLFPGVKLWLMGVNLWLILR